MVYIMKLREELATPYKVLAEKFGFTVENVYSAAKKLI